MLAAAATVLFTAVLMITGYVKCPYWDEWWVVAQIADGASPRKWGASWTRLASSSDRGIAGSTN